MILVVIVACPHNRIDLAFVFVDADPLPTNGDERIDPMRDVMPVSFCWSDQTDVVRIHSNFLAGCVMKNDQAGDGSDDVVTTACHHGTDQSAW